MCVIDNRACPNAFCPPGLVCINGRCLPSPLLTTPLPPSIITPPATTQPNQPKQPMAPMTNRTMTMAPMIRMTTTGFLICPDGRYVYNLQAAQKAIHLKNIVVNSPNNATIEGQKFLKALDEHICKKK
ncbi:unnamed protein product [Dracunculus medinensis]|uniref:EB domain-containing protein n=1 Tax=Dracunculus medinensis TaxID=318479 RepID=A0A0N4U149_DRAME|nr:unnamed protein product [Dracunculus medinensis]